MKRFILFLALLTAFAVQISAQTEEQRIERLSGLAKAWGAVKYFHPFLPSEKIDWDRALIETIPKFNQAKSSEEYAAAINLMLARLDDERYSRARISFKNESVLDVSADKTEPFRIAEGVLIIDLIRLSETAQTMLPKIIAQIPNAKAVVLDCRAKGELSDEARSKFFQTLFNFVPQIADQPINTGAKRYRTHSGYVPQTGTTSGGYYSGLTQTTASVITGKSKTPMPPAVVIYNDFTPSSEEMFGGLQQTGKVLIVREGARNKPEIGGESFEMELPEGVTVKLRTAISLYADGSTANLQADVVVEKKQTEDAAMNEALKNIRANTFTRTRNKISEPLPVALEDRDKTYAEMEFPAKEYRLLALFRFWNVMNYFFPYKNLTGTDWNAVLPKYIPKFEANRTALEYQITVREMATELHDTHGFVSNVKAFDEKIGGFVPAILLRNIENQTVVFKVLDDKLPVKPGDVVLTVDGEAIEKRRDFIARFYSASTPQSLMRDVHYDLLRGQKDSTAKLTVRGADKQIRIVELPRAFDIADDKYFDGEKRLTLTIAVLPSGFAYVDLERLRRDEVNKMFETIKNTPAVIFDMRGYPNGTAWLIAPRLTEKNQPIAALFSRPFAEAVNLYENGVGEQFNFAQPIPKREGDVYKGKIVMLIDEYAQSQAEHTALFFETARPDITFIGTPTAGANGDVTKMVLPGKIFVNFSGQAVRHADGRQLQRVGIQPTIKVAPTIRGNIEGKDEILDAAIKFLQENKK